MHADGKAARGAGADATRRGRDTDVRAPRSAVAFSVGLSALSPLFLFLFLCGHSTTATEKKENFYFILTTERDVIYGIR